MHTTAHPADQANLQATFCRKADMFILHGFVRLLI